MISSPVDLSLIGCILFPLLTGVIVFLVKGRWGLLVRIGCACVLLVFTTRIAAHVYEHGSIRYELGRWGSPLGIDLYVDGLSAIMLLITSFIGGCISIYAASYMPHLKKSRSGKRPTGLEAEDLFWPLLFLAWASLNAVFLSADLFNLYIALEALTLTAIGLLTLAGSSAAVSAAVRYLFLAYLGAMSYLLGVGLVYSAYGSLDLAMLSTSLQRDLLTATATGCIVWGLLTKAALFPMHIWLPPAHSNAPAPVSALLSGLVVTASYYVLVRFWFGLFKEVVGPWAGHLLGILGSIAILWGALQALRQSRLKLLVAYSTVSQLGYLFLLFPLVLYGPASVEYAWYGGVYYAVNHACAKASAFLAAGALMLHLGHDRIERLNGVARSCPVLVFAFALAGISLLGLPPSGGFVAKWMLLKAAMLSGQWWYAGVIVLGGLMAAGYIFRVLERTMLHSLDEEIGISQAPGMHMPTLVLACLSILLGLMAWLPLDLLKIASPISHPLASGLVP